MLLYLLVLVASLSISGECIELHNRQKASLRSARVLFSVYDRQDEKVVGTVSQHSPSCSLPSVNTAVKMGNRTDEQWIKELSADGQSHLFPQGASKSDVTRLLEQVKKADESYPGGVFEYFNRARKLLMESKNEVNPFEGFTPEEPAGERLTVGTEAFKTAEEVGVGQLAATCFVLVAGGLGERLGYPGIKIALPSESSTGTLFIELYVKNILAFQSYAAKELKRNVELPLVIMTSDDTHVATVEIITKNNYFGMKPNQITIVKQEKVPAITDNDGRISVSPTDTFSMDTKPHGHGDVHTLLLQKNLPARWHELGYKWIVFFQDTNGLVFRCIPAVLGVSATRNFIMNTVAVPRKPGEPLGSICKLKRPDGSNMTLNVEYNQLEPLLKATVNKAGDTPNANGYSPFPGNTNVFVISIPRYAEVLKSTGGAIPEFVNPKYADASKTKFKAATRLECMMQDFPKLLSSNDLVGFTEMERWFCFSTVKNNKVDASVKAKAGVASESAFSGESDQYSTAARLLSMAATHKGCAVDIPLPVPVTYGGVDYQLGPRVVLMPSFAVSYEHLKSRFGSDAKGKTLKLSLNSTLVLEGNVLLNGVDVDGTLIARAEPGTALKLDNHKVVNKGWETKPLTAEEENTAPPHIQIRAFKIIKHHQSLSESSLDMD